MWSPPDYEKQSPKVIVQRMEQFNYITCLKRRKILDQFPPIHEPDNAKNLAVESTVLKHFWQNEDSCYLLPDKTNGDTSCSDSHSSKGSEYYILNQSIEGSDMEEYDNKLAIDDTLSSLSSDYYNSVPTYSGGSDTVSASEAADDESQSFGNYYIRRFEGRSPTQNLYKAKRKLSFFQSPCNKYDV